MLPRARVSGRTTCPVVVFTHPRLAPGGDLAEQRLAPFPFSCEPLISMELPQHAATHAAHVAALVAADVGRATKRRPKRHIVVGLIKCT